MKLSVKNEVEQWDGKGLNEGYGALRFKRRSKGVFKRV